MDVYKLLLTAIDNREKTALVTITDAAGFTPDPTGSKALVFPDGRAHFEDACPDELKKQMIDDALAALNKRTSAVYTAKVEGSHFEYFIDVYLPPEHLIVAGAGHVAKPVVEIGKMLGFHVTVICDRPEFANREQFPWADEVVCQPYTEYFREVSLDNNPYILLLTRGHKFDVLILRILLEREYKGYIGMIGSRRRISGVFSQLKRDFPDATFDHIHSPVGLDIGAESPEEIAVSILAEILQVKNGSSARPLREVVRHYIVEPEKESDGDE